MFVCVCVRPHTHIYTCFTFLVIMLFFYSDNFAMGKDLEIGLSSNRDLQRQRANDFSTKPAGTRQNNLIEIGSGEFVHQIDKGQLKFNYESPSSELKYDGATITGVVTDPTDPLMDSTQFEASNRQYKALDRSTKANSNTHEPSVELSLKRLRGVKGTETTVQDDRNVLRRSDSSAFSRYEEHKDLILLLSSDKVEV